MKKDRFRFRHLIIYKAAHLITPLMLRRFPFKTDKKSGLKSTIIMANHLTEVDMLMLIGAFGSHAYFVAGEHLIRSKNGARFDWAQAPIYKYKGDSDLDAVKEIVRCIRSGHNVILFPEGSRSFNGETEALPESVGKLVKLAGAGLVTYHIEGGYFVAPRWAYTERQGPMKGTIVRTLSKEEVAGISSEQLTRIINEDLYEHAYKRQRTARLKYTGERLAEGLENYLVKCPRCGAFDSLSTADDAFRCTACGLSGIYNEEGFLEGDALPYDNVYDWGRWAEDETTAYILACDRERACFTDRNVRLYEITPDHREVTLGTGDITGYRDRLEACGQTFPLKDIEAVSMLYFGKTLLFTSCGRHFGITGESFHAIKYNKLFDACKAEG